jgi:ribosome-binding protein aMBF1 (putative translation factor)
MPTDDSPVQLEPALRLERELGEERRRVAFALRSKRHASGLSLRQLAAKAHISAPALSNIERGAQWETKTIVRLAKLYDRLSA